MTPSEAVRELRSRLGISQQAMATSLGLSIGAIQNYEAGRNPTAKALMALARKASSENLDDLAMVFLDAFLDELGLSSGGVHLSLRKDGVFLATYPQRENPVSLALAHYLVKVGELFSLALEENTQKDALRRMDSVIRAIDDSKPKGSKQ